MDILNIDRNTKRWIFMVVDLIFMILLILLFKSTFIKELNNEFLNITLGFLIFLLLIKWLYFSIKIILNIDTDKKEEQKQ